MKLKKFTFGNKYERWFYRATTEKIEQFVADPDTCEAQPEWTILLKNVLSIEKSTKKPEEFQINVVKQSIRQFKCPTMEDRNRWVEELKAKHKHAINNAT